MNLAESISIIAVLVSILSASYAKWAAKEAKKANELNRFKALLDLKSGYLKDMDDSIQAAKNWGKDDGFAQSCRERYATADTRNRDVCKELDVYHSKLIKNEL